MEKKGNSHTYPQGRGGDEFFVYCLFSDWKSDFSARYMCGFLIIRLPLTSQATTPQNQLKNNRKKAKKHTHTNIHMQYTMEAAGRVAGPRVSSFTGPWPGNRCLPKPSHTMRLWYSAAGVYYIYIYHATLPSITSCSVCNYSNCFHWLYMGQTGLSNNQCRRTFFSRIKQGCLMIST